MTTTNKTTVLTQLIANDITARTFIGNEGFINLLANSTPTELRSLKAKATAARDSLIAFLAGDTNDSELRPLADGRLRLPVDGVLT